MSRPTLLLTGFSPFLAYTTNASADLARDIAAAATRRWTGWRFEARVLPTEWCAGPAAVLALYDELRPVIAIHFGVASKAAGFEIEMRAANAALDKEDAKGRTPPAENLVEGGPPSRLVSLPTRRILARLRERGLPARLSGDAGGYICNAVLYNALAHADGENRPMRCGFVHVPGTLAAVPAPDAETPPMTWDAAVQGGLVIVETTLASGRPRRRTAPSS